MSKRPIKAITAPDIVPIAPPTNPPRMKVVDPKSLVVDESYQRELSRQSITMIRKMIANWDWRKFKPPIVAETPDGDEVIDGQHTAIAAASNPHVKEILVLVIEAPDMAGRAASFVGHNRERVNLTSMQMHFAAVAAGDEDAMTVQQVCDRAGISILRYPPSGGRFRLGDTLAVVVIRALCNRRGALGARQVLEVLAKANCAPVSASLIRSVESLLFDAEFKGEADGADISSALMLAGAEIDKEAALFAASHNVQHWRALTSILFRRAKRGRRRAT